MTGKHFEPVSAWRRYPKHHCVACGQRANSHVSNIGFTCAEHYDAILDSECLIHGHAMGRSALRYPWKSEFVIVKHRIFEKIADWIKPERIEDRRREEESQRKLWAHIFDGDA